MTKMINSKRGEKDLPYATDEECLEMRNRLVAKDHIVPGDMEYGRGGKVRTTALRKQLVAHGFLNPVERLPGGVPSFCETIPNSEPYRGSEEGEYSCRQIGSSDEYLRRRQAYFRMLQEILHSRRELRLVLGQKKSTDPDWYF
jgi:hypothetical protein